MRALVGLALSGVAAGHDLPERGDPSPPSGLAMGLYIGGNAIGGMSGRLLSGVLVDYLSWHSVLGLMGGLALLAALLLWRFLPESRHFRPRPLQIRRGCCKATACTSAMPACPGCSCRAFC